MFLSLIRNHWKTNQNATSLLDLPDSTLECILERLPPCDLCKVATVCTSLRDKCRSDHLWVRLTRQRWGGVIGDVALREWQRFKALREKAKLMGRRNPFESSGSFYGDWVILTVGSTSTTTWQWSDSTANDSAMAWCVSLESGRFWFPAQVNKKDEAGVIVYWSDALLSYDFRTDTFRARYPHDGWRRTLTHIKWDEVRSPVVDVSPYAVYTSDCLNDLRPGDHIEMQWKCHRRIPYDWWYAVIGHLESCNGHHWTYCHCCNSDILIVEFNRYSSDSPPKRVVLSRKDCDKAQGSEEEGFYGGIRKLQNEEIQVEEEGSLDKCNHNELKNMHSLLQFYHMK